MHNKSEALMHFKDFKVHVENQYSAQIKQLHTDNGSEYLNAQFQDYLCSCGIVHECTTPYMPQQNGMAVCTNQTLMDMVCSMLMHAQLPKPFWGDVLHYAAWIKMCTPRHALKGSTPFEALTQEKPDISCMHMFGCHAWVHIPEEWHRKLDVHSAPYIFIGFEDGIKGAKVHTSFSRDIIFDERTLGIQEVDASAFPVEEDEEAQVETQLSVQTGTLEEHVPRTLEESAVQDPDEEDLEVEHALIAHVHIVQGDAQDLHTIEEAHTRTDWMQWEGAIKKELASLESNQTWELAHLPPRHTPVGSKWVFKIKLKADGAVDKYKAHLVAQGFMQHAGIDYEETFAPVLKFATLHLLIALAAHNNWHVHQMDVETVYLNGELEEEIYMLPPPGYVQGNMVCKLHKALYGLKQAGRTWFVKIDRWLNVLCAH
uniref:Retrovirus-related pol polyprotein n=1 Tax=Ustilago esculenta TaxID=185366 RepID=A0A481SFM3_9BASI|nr:retrovirus-related pol polyprotein [Ustilago esculenta]